MRVCMYGWQNAKQQMLNGETSTASNCRFWCQRTARITTDFGRFVFHLSYCSVWPKPYLSEIVQKEKPNCCRIVVFRFVGKTEWPYRLLK